MIPLLCIDTKADRSAALTERLAGTGQFRVMVSAAQEVTISRHLAESDAVVIAVHEEGQNGLAFLTHLREQGVGLPVIILAGAYDPGVFFTAVTRRAEIMVMEGPVDAWYPALACLIDKVCTARRQADLVAFLEKKLNLVGSVTRHDVLNQLTAVSGYTELLEMVTTDPQMKSYIEKERTALEKIRRQFQFAKEYQNLAAEPPRWEPIASAVRRGSEMVALGSVALEESCGNAAVYADPALEKAIGQLLDNAIRHGDHVTRIRISVQEDSGGALLVVEDDGIGIPKENKPRLFDRGFGKHTGWGLFLVSEILALTGMTITETGEPGKGARFEIRIPAGCYRNESL
ncbi:sensor histidine kinase [Methanoregula sp. UBA64]|jgi:signal transduction histidine kinase|uniref:sensor histidine kinase n=1 Tax=Methanoregula sp. UBA64 TaxID=1915554 RepID=UPI0025DDB3AD|nr:HAMP domain-containing sensor histidine kinase [Methanoregula sp. UBA64]